MLNFRFSPEVKSGGTRGTADVTPWLAGLHPSRNRAFERIYALADLHGHFDLFRDALRLIQHDNARRGPAQTVIVVAGDIIDRGPDSRQLLQILQRFHTTSTGLVVLRGNHEQMLLDAVDGREDALRLWLKNGGVQTLESYGVDLRDFLQLHKQKRPDHLRKVIGDSTLSWLRSRPLSYRSGGYFFCHAGVRPGVKLGKQREADLLWIRDEFQESDADHGAVVVHGHCDRARVEKRHNRINIDTGAYRTGRLGILGLEGDDKWELYAEQQKMPERTTSHRLAF